MLTSLASPGQAEEPGGKGLGGICLEIPRLLSRLLGPVPCRAFELRWFY